MVPCIYNIATTIAMPNLTYQNQNICSKKTKKIIFFITFHTFIQLISFVEHESNAIDSLFWQVGHAWDTLAKLQIGSDKNVHINSTLHSFQRHGRRKNHEVLKIIHKLIESTKTFSTVYSIVTTNSMGMAPTTPRRGLCFNCRHIWLVNHT